MVTLKCRECGAHLNETQLGTGKCPECGALLDVDEQQASDAASRKTRHNGTHDVDSVGGDADQTVVPPSAEIPPAPQQTPVEESSGKATTFGSGNTIIAKTVVGAGPEPDVPSDQTVVAGDQSNIRATINPMYLADDAAATRPALSNILGGKAKRPQGGKQTPETADSEERTVVSAGGEGAAEEFEAGGPVSQSTGPEGVMSIGDTLVSVRKVDGLGGHHVSRADYEIVGTLGKGGMGIVYEARQASTNRSVALKMLLPKEAAKPSRRQTLMSEAVINGNLTHPNIVPVHDLGQDEQGNLFYSMKRVEGEKWESVIATKSEAENLEILLKVADAVAFSHARGIVHCDLKPENVLLGEFGEVLLMDWGLAYATESFAKRDSILVSDNPGGSPAYMAPEQAINFLISCKYMPGTVGQTGPATDIYLLGAILFQIVTGRAPHVAENVMKTVTAAAKNEIVKPNLESGYLEIAFKAMATDPAERYESVPALQAAIRGHLAHEQSVALNKRADEHFRAKDYSRAITVCEDALALWAGNDVAKKCMGVAERRLRRRRNAVGTLAVTLTLAVVGFTIAVTRERNEARRQEKIAIDEKDKADAAAEAEKKAKEIAVAEKDKADAAAVAEKTAKEIAVAEKNKADAAAAAEKTAKEIAVAEKRKADDAAMEANRQERLAVRAAGRANIKLAKEQYDKNLFDAAEKTLAGIRDPEMTDSWEYRHLKYVLQQDYPPLPVTSDVNSVAGDPQGRFVITGESNGDIRIWDTNFQVGVEQKSPLPLKFQSTVRCMAVSPDGKLFAAAGDAEFGKNARIRIWQAPEKPGQGDFVERQVEMPVDDPRASVTSLAFVPDGKKILSTATDGYVYVWDVDSGRRIAKLRPNDYLSAPKPSAPNAPTQVAVSPDGTKFVVAHGDGHVYGWEFAAPDSRKSDDTATPATEPVCVGCFYGHREDCKERSALCVATGATGPSDAGGPDWSIVSGGSEGHILVWTWDQLQDLKRKEPLDDVVRNKLRLTANRSVRVVRAVDRRANEFGADLIDEKLRGLKASESAIRAVALTKSAGGVPLIVSAGDDSVIRLWAPVDDGSVTPWKAPWQVIKRVRGQSHPIGSFAVFSPPEKEGNMFVLSGGEESQARLWNVTFYKDVRSGDADVLPGSARGFEKGVNDIYVARFVPGQRRLLTANAEEDMFGFRRFVEIVDLDGTQKNQNHLSFTAGHHFPMRVERLAPFPDGKRLMSVGTDDMVIIWDIATGRELGRIPGIGTLGVAALSHDGAWIATGSSHRIDPRTSKPLTQFAKLWRTQDVLDAAGQTTPGKPLEPVAQLECGTHDVTSLAFSPDDKTILVGDADGKCTVWKRETNDRPTSYQIHDKTGALTWVRAIRFLADGLHAVSVGSNGSIAHWNVATGSAVGQPLSVRDLAKIKIDDVAISPDGNRVAVAGQLSAKAMGATQLQMWDLAQRKKIWESEIDNVTSIDFAPDGSRIVTTNSPKDKEARPRHVQFWDAGTGRTTTQTLENHNPSAKSPEFAIFSNDGRSILTESVTVATAGIVEQKVAWWDVSVPGAAAAHQLNEFSLTTVIASADMSGDARYVVTANVDGTMDILEVEGESLRWINKVVIDKEKREPLLSVALSPVKGSYAFVVGSRDGSVRVGRLVPEKLSGAEGDGVEWTTTDWKHAEQVWTTAFSADGSWLLTGGFDGRIFVCRADDLKHPLTLEHRPSDDEAGQADARFSNVLCATFVPNPSDPTQTAVVSGAGDGVTRVWRLVAGGKLGSDLSLQLKGHREDIYGVCAFQSGQTVRIVTAGKDKTTTIWDPTRLWDADPALAPADRVQEALSLQEYHTGPIRAVAYSPETNAILTAGADGRTILYPAPKQ